MNGSNLTVSDWYVLTKINRAIVPVACLLLGALLTGNFSLLVIFPALSIVLIYASSAALNDIFDSKIDRIANPNRPIPSHRLDIPGAYFIVLLVLVFGILSSLLISYFFDKLFFVMIGLFAFILGIVYCIKGSKHFIVANGILGLSHGFLPLISGAYLFGSITLNVVGIGAVIYVALFLTYNIKDFKDFKGDMGQRNTLPTIFRENTAKKIMFCIFFFLLPLTLFANWFFGLSKVHLVLSIGASFVLMWLSLMLFNGDGKKYEKVLNLYRYVIVIYILSFGL